MDVLLLHSSRIIHKRSVYNFLFVLADFGGYQLILTVIISYITSKANDRKSLHSIIKKFFFIRTHDKTFMDYPVSNPLDGEENIYLFKFSRKTK